MDKSIDLLPDDSEDLAYDPEEHSRRRRFTRLREPSDTNRRILEEHDAAHNVHVPTREQKSGRWQSARLRRLSDSFWETIEQDDSDYRVHDPAHAAKPSTKLIESPEKKSAKWKAAKERRRRRSHLKNDLKRQKRKNAVDEVLAPLQELYLKTGMDVIDQDASDSIDAKILHELQSRSVSQLKLTKKAALQAWKKWLKAQATKGRVQREKDDRELQKALKKLQLTGTGGKLNERVEGHSNHSTGMRALPDESPDIAHLGAEDPNADMDMGGI